MAPLGLQLGYFVLCNQLISIVNHLCKGIFFFCGELNNEKKGERWEREEKRRKERMVLLLFQLGISQIVFFF